MLMDLVWDNVPLTRITASDHNSVTIDWASGTANHMRLERRILFFVFFMQNYGEIDGKSFLVDEDAIYGSIGVEDD